MLGDANKQSAGREERPRATGRRAALLPPLPQVRAKGVVKREQCTVRLHRTF